MGTDTQFEHYITKTVLREGAERYTNNPLDHGGPTRWGITQDRAREWGYTGDMRELPYQTAYAIYRSEFWIKPRFDQIAALFPELAAFMLDTGINNGPSLPSRWLQRALNVLGHAVIVDGLAFLATRQALVQYLTLRGAEGKRVLLHLMMSQAGVHYIELAEHDPSQKTFEFGWLANRAFPKEFAAWLNPTVSALSKASSPVSS